MGVKTHEEKLRNIHDIANRARWAVWNCRKPVISAIHGYCLGGAFELVLPTDFTIAAESCRLGEPEILFGVGPAFIMVPWMVNHKVAKDVPAHWAPVRRRRGFAHGPGHPGRA